MDNVILSCNNINKKYSKKTHYHIASDNVSFNLYEGECLALVGESGSGKSTLANMIMNLETADSGSIILDGQNITNVRGRKLNKIYKDIQMVFQDAVGSFNPKMTIGDSIKEYLCTLCVVDKKQREVKTDELLKMVGLPVEFKHRYPYQLSGGQCQRAAIARAISSHPKVLIFDEATSALDVSVQAQIVQLLKNMKQELNLSYIFITHDLALVSSFCDRVVVLRNGSIEEMGEVNEVLNKPQSEYTKLLLNSIL